MKKYLFIALAALGFAACAEKDEMGKQPINNGETEQSYVAVTFTADGVTRADEYVVGTDAERAVNSAYIFFFDKNGNAFTVNGKESHPGDRNYVNVIDDMDGQPNDADGDAMSNVSDIKDKVIVLEKYKGEYPSQVVAVLNWTPDSTKPADYYSLSQLKKEISTLGNDTTGYVMSNSVYLNANSEIVDAVALTEANIAKNEADAKANPIVIHVERIAARVDFAALNNGRFNIKRTVMDTVDDQVNGSANETEVYAQIVGFELYNDYEKSWLIKRVSESWGLGDAVVGFNWNESGRYRSFWATSLSPADGENFPANRFSWNSDNTKLDDPQPWVYCGENTREWNPANDVRTKVIVKAQLVDKDGNPVEVVSWWGKEYVTEDHLKTVVANTLNTTYFKLVGSEYVGIEPQDLECVARNSSEDNAYEVYFCIAQSKKGENWYKYMDSKYDEIALDKLNEELKEVQPALVYKNGMTYYYTDIRHLDKNYEGKLAEYGVVRNHIYSVNITDITGYGTPVYDPNIEFETPDKPEDIETYVAAQINILSWRVVDNTTELK